MLSPIPFNDVFELLICLGIEIAESEILEFATDFSHAQPVRKRRIDIHCLAGDGFAAIGGQISKRSHVVQAVGKFHHDDADVIGHRQKHLSEILCLLLLLGRERNLADLGDAVDDVRNFGTEKRFDFFEGGQGVFNNIMEKTDTDRDGIHLHFG